MGVVNLERLLKKIGYLVDNNNYLEALDKINICIEKGNHSNELFILKARSLQGLGRIAEASSFFWRRINWITPTNIDIIMIDLLIESCKANTWELVANRLIYLRTLIMKSNFEESTSNIDRKIKCLMKKIENETFDGDTCLELAELLFTQNEHVKSAIFIKAYEYFSDNPIPIIELELGASMSSFVNINDIYLYLSDDNSDLFALVVEREKDNYDYYILAKILSKMNKNVVVLSNPVRLDIGNSKCDYNEIHDISYQNSEIIDSIEYIVPIDLYSNDIFVERTTFSLLEDIAKRNGNHLPIIAELETLDSLRSNRILRKELHYVCNGFEFFNATNCTSFGYVGGYEKYISTIYGIDAVRELKKADTCKISIILPVRNNADTLKYTLKTCLEQNFNDYEIVISDNSDIDNFEIKKLVDSMNSSKIKYYRTPRNLPISKSFEFAYILSSGEFLVPIGSDDGIMPNGLSNLNEIINKYPNEKVFTWDRPNYVWPNFMVKNQRDQLIINRPYIPGNVRLNLIESDSMLHKVLNDVSWAYNMPLLYLNSGMKRSFLLDLLNDTGAIIDGVSQDLYTGIAVLNQLNRYYHIEYPITIAALSSNSSGANSIIGAKNSEIVKKRDEELLSTNIGIHVERGLERIIPMSDGDVANLINSLLRMVDMQCVGDEILHKINWKYIYTTIAEQLQEDDLYLETTLLRLKNSAEKISEDLFNWFNDQILGCKFNLIKLNNDDYKNYYKGFKSNGNLQLDASEFGVSNVYEATKFISTLMNI